jgi:hypothetical protein
MVTYFPRLKRYVLDIRYKRQGKNGWTFRRKLVIVRFEIHQFLGAWRSLVAYLHGVQVVAGSNPAAPTIKIS